MRMLNALPLAVALAGVVERAPAGDVADFVAKARSGTRCERTADGVVRVECDGSYAWPGVGLGPADGKTWDFSGVGVVEVTVSNTSAKAETIHATVLG